MNPAHAEVVPLLYPIDVVSLLLYTKHLTQAQYQSCREEWIAYHKQWGRKWYPLSLRPGEETTMDFIDYKLTGEEMEEALLWPEGQGPELFEHLDTIVKSGYRIAYVLDKKNNCITVTFIGKSHDNPNHDKAMSTKHSTVLKALQVALYKHLVIFRGDAWGDLDSEGRFG